MCLISHIAIRTPPNSETVEQHLVALCTCLHLPSGGPALASPTALVDAAAAWIDAFALAFIYLQDPYYSALATGRDPSHRGALQGKLHAASDRRHHDVVHWLGRLEQLGIH